MKLYTEMVTLDRAQDRQTIMRRELDAAGIDCPFNAGVDADLVDDATLMKRCAPTGPMGPVSRGYMACNLSHVAIWERFLETDADLCLVFEDDIHISPDLRLWLADLAWWPDQADVVKLEYWRDPKLILGFERTTMRHLGRRIQRLLTRHVGGAGYILTRDAAHAYLAAEPFDVVIDHLIFNHAVSPTAARMKIYQICPALVMQGNEPEQKVYRMPRSDSLSRRSQFRRQLRRGIQELRYPLSTYAKLLTGRLELRKCGFAATTL